MKNSYSIIALLILSFISCTSINDLSTEDYSDLSNTWILHKMGISNVNSQNNVTLEINVNNNNFKGNAHCNSYAGGLKVSTNNGIDFHEIMRTEMACQELTDEQIFYKLLRKTTSFRVDESTLFLLKNKDEIILEFKK